MPRDTEIGRAHVLTEQMFVPQLTEIVPAFVQNVRVAFMNLIEDPDNLGILAKFRFAYEYRKRFHWLGESGLVFGIQDGLEYALSEALALYNFGIDNVDSECGRHEADEEFLQQLSVAIERLVLDQVSVQSFLHILTYNNINVAAINSHDLSGYIKQCIEHYCARMIYDIAIHN